MMKKLLALLIACGFLAVQGPVFAAEGRDDAKKSEKSKGDEMKSEKSKGDEKKAGESKDEEKKSTRRRKGGCG